MYIYIRIRIRICVCVCVCVCMHTCRFTFSRVLSSVYTYIPHTYKDSCTYISYVPGDMLVLCEHMYLQEFG